MSATLEKLEFPVLPEYRAAWQPIFLEPLQGSGERLTVAVAIKGSDGAVWVAPTFCSHLTQCFVGRSESARILQFISVCAKSAEIHLNERFSLNGWEPPLSGFSIGDPRDAVGNDIEDVLMQAVCMSSYFGAMRYKTNRFSKEKGIRSRAWQSKIKKEIVRRVRDAAKCFDVQIPSLGGRLSTRIGFFCADYAANFGVVSGDAKKNSTQLINIQGKLWQLDRLRDASSIDLPKQTELILEVVGGADQEGQKAAEDFLEEIRLEADRRDIGVFQARDVPSAAEHLIGKVA